MTKQKAKKALILAIGNVLMTDDGAGLAALETFGRTYLTGDDVECLDGGTSGPNLLDVLKGFTHLVIVDAVASGKEPGTIHRYKGADILRGEIPLASAHGMGVKELLALSDFEGQGLTSSVIGITPERITPGLAVTDTIEGILPDIAESIAKELEASGFKVKKRP